MPRPKQFKIDLPLYVDPFKPERRQVLIETTFYKPGNRLAARENMPPESHDRRMQGLFKTWGSHYRKQNKGVATVRKRTVVGRKKAKAREERNRVRLTVAKEAREIQEMARKSAAQAMEVARTILADTMERASDRLAAANFITERAYGKATQTNVNASVDANGSKTEASAEELNQRIEETLRRAEELAGRASKPKAGAQRPVNVRKRYRHPGSSALN